MQVTKQSDEKKWDRSKPESAGKIRPLSRSGHQEGRAAGSRDTGQ